MTDTLIALLFQRPRLPACVAGAAAAGVTNLHKSKRLEGMVCAVAYTTYTRVWLVL